MYYAILYHVPLIYFLTPRYEHGDNVEIEYSKHMHGNNGREKWRA